MPDYRLYCMALASDGKLSRITKAIEIAAVGDANAIAKAKDLKEAVVCELWKREPFGGHNPWASSLAI